MIYVIRLWDKRERHEGVRLGTVRYHPRGYTKEKIAKLYDAWLPELAPSRKLLRASKEGKLTGDTFLRRYRTEMKEPATRHLITFLARISHETNLSVGCYCDEYDQCHRSVLHELLDEAGAKLHTPYRRRRRARGR